MATPRSADYRWLAGLREGDRVVILATGPGMRRRKISTVQKITPTGKFRVDGRLFSRVGTRTIDSFHDEQLLPATPELEAEIREGAERSRRITRLQRYRWEDVPTETLRAIAALLSPKEEGA